MSLSSLNLIGQTVFELESGNENVDRRTDKRTKRRNYTYFERNLAMMVIYVPVKLEFDRTNRFRVKSLETKMWTDRWTDKRTKDGRNFTNFERNLAMMVSYLPVKFEFNWTNRFRVRVRKRKMWMDRRTSDTSI